MRIAAQELLNVIAGYIGWKTENIQKDEKFKKRSYNILPLDGKN